MNKYCEKARDKSNYQIFWVDEKFETDVMKIYIMGLKDLGFKKLNCFKELDELK